MIGTLAKASFAYIFRWVLFIFLAIATNIWLAINYLGSDGLLGVITMVTVTVFPIIWFVMAKKTALFVAIFKVVDESIDDLVEFVVDTFLVDDNKSKIANYDKVFAEQSKVTQMVLNFFFEQVDFFSQVESLMSQEEYSDGELKQKMIETIEDKEAFEKWEPSMLTPLYLLGVNIGVVVLASHFL
ncbi:hypothetical protein GSY74_04775 [Sulfurovum sp. bin170]|uniref:hypothetical protein n=1 Tax=Sulfurovum sp. bin170 TaxID=2695268 RepID=UPI0013DF6DFF|nr:hypothetical protein [Sulfurovum sp. bin170]NEW60590.1 hypothetical protein [Sulfurovum sp. bin170]